MNDDFVNLIKCEYDEMKIELNKASIEGKGTPQEIADRREMIYHSFFEKYFPFPFRITKGNIVDSYNKRSASIDCIILDPSHPYTIDAKNNKASIIFADGVDYAIEIKGKLTDKHEITRALDQIKSVKNLTRVRNGLVFERDRNEYTYKISTILIAIETYTDINKLIDTIVNYYKENKIKRINQFDIIIAGEYTIVNSCKGQISFGNQNGIFLKKTDNLSLGVLLFLMANMPLVQPSMNENIYNIYLDGITSDFYYSDSWNDTLNQIEKNN